MLRAILEATQRPTLRSSEQHAYERDIRPQISRLPVHLEDRLAVFASKVPRDVRVLPCPLELERGELRREAVDDHLHDPGPIVLCLPCALGDLAIVLPSAPVRGGVWETLNVRTGYVGEDLVCCRYMFYRIT